MEEIKRLLKRDRYLLTVITLFFLISVLAGALLPKFYPDEAQQIIKFFAQHLRKIAEKIKHAPVGVQIFTIWFNNLSASITAIVSGVLIFPPLLSLLINGVGIGAFQYYTQVHAKMGELQYYLSLAPHGIFEIPAFLLAVAMGVKFGLCLWRWFWHYFMQGENLPILREFFRELKYYGALMLVLLTVAAVIEITLTPQIMIFWQRLIR